MDVLVGVLLELSEPLGNLVEGHAAKYSKTGYFYLVIS